MPDPASLTASPEAPGTAPSSPLTARGPARYEVREELWGNHKRFVVRDTATDSTVAIRASSQIADSDLIRLNWAARVLPDPEARHQPAVTHSPPEVTSGSQSQRQCGRCRQFFSCDAALNPVAIQDWWICEPCHDKLMGVGAPTGTGSVGSGRVSSHLLQ